VRLALTPHPDTPSEAVRRIEVEVARRGRDLALSFRLTGSLDRLLIPPPAPPVRADGLWQHSCFEAFIRPAGSEAYREFNFSPSGEWAAYRFDSYRSGMSDLEEFPPPRIATRSGEVLEVEVGLVPGLPGESTWQLGLSAVVEEASGGKSYWALAHPPGQPDFHSRDCFALELAPPPRP
jgi:hypothetical protein